MYDIVTKFAFVQYYAETLLAGLSERDFNCYIRFRIVLFNICLAIFGPEFVQYIINRITVRYGFTLCRSYFFSTYRNFQSFILLEVLIPVRVRALNWKQIQSVSLVHKPDWPRDIIA